MLTSWISNDSFPVHPPIKIKELRNFASIPISEDDNVRMPQNPADVILPMNRLPKLAQQSFAWRRCRA